MSDESFYDRKLHPGAETVHRPVNRETIHGSQSRSQEPPPWQVGQRVGDFQFEAILGSGVTSTVYRVRQLSSGRRCALKVVHLRGEEALSASRLGYRRVMPLSHPSLVRIHGMHQLDDRLGFTMDEVRGKPVNQAAAALGGDRERLFAMAARMIRDVGGALQTLHAAGLVHRDVKPENLMVEPSGLIRLIDYGLVGSYDPESDPDARRSYLAGTFWYMAPESITSQIYPPACDVYALGCVLLEMIADLARLPDLQQGRSLVDAIGELERVIPTDTPEEMRELLQEMLDPKIENRPLAPQLVRFGRESTLSGADGGTPFRPTDLIGREDEMQKVQRWFHNVARSGSDWLHLSGEPGIGKTWFVNELRRRLSLNPWFQVFSASCMQREDSSLQIFDDIADTVARRYSRSDRNPLKLSPTSAQILTQSFPALKPIIQSDSAPTIRSLSLGDAGQRFPGSEGGRAAPLAAGIEFVNQLCHYGPVLLIIDDIQWADLDSIEMLDNLLDGVTGAFGILTVSPQPHAPLRHSVQQSVRLDPLDRQQSLRLLHNVLGGSRLAGDSQALENLAKMGRGSAFRLIQLAAELESADGSNWHERLREGAVNAEEIWQAKLGLLDQRARRYLNFLLTAGGPVSIDLIGQAAGLDEDEDADLMAWEMIRHRLARESATDGTEIEIIHSRIVERGLRDLPAEEKAALHIQWAELLQRNDGPQQGFAPRIAWHLLQAGRTRDAIPYARQAAADALRRFAYVRAAKWYTQIAELTEPGQDNEALYSALECLETGQQFAAAANICQQLLDDPRLDPESAEARILGQRLVQNLLRCPWPLPPGSPADQLARQLGQQDRRLKWRFFLARCAGWLKQQRPAALRKAISKRWRRQLR